MPYDLMYFRTKATPSMQENQVTLHLFRIVILWSNCEQVLQILKQSPEGFHRVWHKNSGENTYFRVSFLLKLQYIIHTANTLFTIKIKCCSERTKAWTSNTNLPQNQYNEICIEIYRVFLIGLTLHNVPKWSDTL